MVVIFRLNSKVSFLFFDILKDEITECFDRKSDKDILSFHFTIIFYVDL